MYLIPASPVEAEIREKGSRFLALVSGVSGDEAAWARLEEVRRRFPDATHHCWAWRLGPAGLERASDDGEPAGTAGMPILRVLRGAELSDVLAVVVRWFGGTKLGKGGLARAYAAAVKEALAGLAITERHPTVYLTLTLPYERLGAVKRLIHPPALEIRGEEYGSAVTLRLEVHTAAVPGLKQTLADLGLTPE